MQNAFAGCQHLSAFAIAVIAWLIDRNGEPCANLTGISRDIAWHGEVILVISLIVQLLALFEHDHIRASVRAHKA